MTTAATTITADAIRAVDVTKVYGTGDTAVHALDHVDVGFAAGRFTAIMGPSGSGKSTLMHCLAGLDSVTGGRVLLGDTDLTALDDDALTIVRRTRLGFVFQAFNLLPTLDARANIALPLTLGGGAVRRGVLRSGRRRDEGAAARGAKRTDERDRAGGKPDPIWFDAVVDVLGLGDRLTHRPSELSGGQQQRVALARALVTRPDVLFADEPTGNLDSASGAEVLSFLRSSVRELGRTVVMVTHDPGAAAYADRVVLLADGRTAGEITDPTVDTVIDALRSMDGGR